jgi:hypothetical protein
VLLATLEVRTDASRASHDIAVTRPRKRGILTESFDVLNGLGSELDARFRFAWSGHSSGEFNVDDRFVLTKEDLYKPTAAYALTWYSFEQFEQIILAQSPRADGLSDSLMCWSPGGRVRQTGTRLLECWFFVGEDWQGSELGEYSSFIGGIRPADGSGRITFTSVRTDRLEGTFSITMHDDTEWPGETITITNGSFSMPVISSYALR